MPIRGVFFDLHNTLLLCTNDQKAWSDWSSALYDTFRAHGHDHTPETFHAQCATLFDGPAPLTPDHLTPYERRLHHLCTTLGQLAAPETVRHAAQASVRAWSAHVIPDPDAIPLLESLRPRVKLALITNFDHPPEIDVMLEDHDLTRHFNLVLISGQVGIDKPDPAIFRLALDTLGLRPEEVAHVGDSEADVAGAQAAGCLPVRILRNGPAPDDGVLTITRLANLPKALSLIT